MSEKLQVYPQILRAYWAFEYLASFSSMLEKGRAACGLLIKWIFLFISKIGFITEMGSISIPRHPHPRGSARLGAIIIFRSTVCVVNGNAARGYGEVEIYLRSFKM